MRLMTRRLTFQLTPLLDLLLIVIFAQYMDVRETAEITESQIEQRAEAAQDELLETREALARLEALHRREQLRNEQQMARLEEQLRSQTDSMQELQVQQSEQSETLDRVLQQRETVGNVIAELFRIPEELVQQLLKPGAPSEAPRTPEEVDRLREQFRELADKRGSEVIKHLLAHEELRKRSDIWEIYVQENGNVMLRTGNGTRELRAESAKTFEDRLFDIYKSLPQPKSLVIILLSYGDAKAVWREAAIRGTRDAAERMRADAGGRTRFEYAILGYLPDRRE